MLLTASTAKFVAVVVVLGAPKFLKFVAVVDVVWCHPVANYLLLLL